MIFKSGKTIVDVFLRKPPTRATPLRGGPLIMHNSKKAGTAVRGPCLLYDQL